MGSGSSRAAKPPARTLTQEETEIINNLTINRDNAGILEGITNIAALSQNDPIFIAKFVILMANINQFNYNTYRTELKKRVTNEILSKKSKNITITYDIIVEVLLSNAKKILMSRVNKNFITNQATYFNSLVELVSQSLDQYGDPDNRPANFNSFLVDKLYTLARRRPQMNINSAATSAVTDITTRFNLTLNPRTTTTETTTVAGFQNKNSFIMKELEKIKRNSKGSTETFRNKQEKESCFTGYNLGHNSLLPKDYADF